MKETLQKFVEEIGKMRSDAFKDGNELLYKHLGRAMGNLIDAKELVEVK